MPTVTIAEAECDRCEKPVDPDETVSGLCHDCIEGSVACVHCNALEPVDDTLPAYPEGRVCRDCAGASYTRCYDCDRYARDFQDHVTRWDGEAVCNACVDAHYRTCDGCSDYINEGNYCNDCDHDDWCGCSDCDTCENHSLVYQYSYKPDPTFHGAGPLYLGLELEINTPRRDLDEAAGLAASCLGDLGYLKEDSSINHGFEIVTHPMSHDWAATRFPWEMLTKLRGMGCSPDGNGLHVHVSRAGFDGPVHIYRWLKFFHRNQREVISIARRESRDWAAFSDASRRNAKGFAKGQAWGDRYSAINTNPTTTLELRIFASSLDEQEVKAALDLAVASVEYTRTLSTRDIACHGGWRWAAFRGWVECRPEYAALAREMEIQDDAEEQACAC